MKPLTSALRKLEKSKYLQGFIYEDRLINVKLLENGNRLSKNLIRKWKEINDSKGSPIFVKHNENSDSTLNSQGKYEFVNSNQFKINLENVKEKFLTHNTVPTIKEIQTITDVAAESEIDFITFSKTQQTTKLVTDYFVNSWRLEHFYNIQRERKIWWMHLSTNPSHYHFKIFVKEDSSSRMQSVTMQSLFPFGDLGIEEISHISLNNSNPHQSCEKFSNISVIRSTIYLEAAVCALLLDACIDTHTDSLIINRKLAPYQCAIICLDKENHACELEDLYYHISNVINDAGIDLYNKNSIFIKSAKTLESEFFVLDNIGVPYVIILEPTTLDFGLMKLRSRDTLLQETIHITDLPNYLLQMLK